MNPGLVALLSLLLHSQSATWTDDRAPRQKTLGQLFNNNFPSPAREISGPARREGAARREEREPPPAAFAFVDVAQSHSQCASRSESVSRVSSVHFLTVLRRLGSWCSSPWPLRPARGLRVVSASVRKCAYSASSYEVQWSGGGL